LNPLEVTVTGAEPDGEFVGTVKLTVTDVSEGFDVVGVIVPVGRAMLTEGFVPKLVPVMVTV
jgi:hypothetical protein